MDSVEKAQATLRTVRDSIAADMRGMRQGRRWFDQTIKDLHQQRASIANMPQTSVMHAAVGAAITGAAVAGVAWAAYRKFNRPKQQESWSERVAPGPSDPQNLGR